MPVERDDGSRAPARQRADASAHRAEALLTGPFADPPDAALAVRMAICHALLAIYWELRERSGPTAVSTAAEPPTTAVAGNARVHRSWGTEPGA